MHIQIARGTQQLRPGHQRTTIFQSSQSISTSQQSLPRDNVELRAIQAPADSPSVPTSSAGSSWQEKSLGSTALVALSALPSPGLGAAVADSGFQTVWRSQARMVIKPERVDAFKVALAKIVEPTRAEPGCVDYRGFVILDERGVETNQFEFQEVWKSKEAMFEDHLGKAPHMKTFFEEIKFQTEESYIAEFIPLSSGYANMVLPEA